jgi:hypothetical protein
MLTQGPRDAPSRRAQSEPSLLHPIHHMRAGIGQSFALLGDIEPRGTRIRQPCDDFVQIMHAAQQPARFMAGARDGIPKRRGCVANPARAG